MTAVYISVPCVGEITDHVCRTASDTAERLGLLPLPPYQGVWTDHDGAPVHLFATHDDLPVIEASGLHPADPQEGP